LFRAAALQTRIEKAKWRKRRYEVFESNRTATQIDGCIASFAVGLNRLSSQIKASIDVVGNLKCRSVLQRGVHREIQWGLLGFMNGEDQKHAAKGSWVEEVISGAVSLTPTLSHLLYFFMKTLYRETKV